MIDVTYKNLIKKILNEGYNYYDPNRKGVKRFEIPSYELRHNFERGFPAISLKKLAWKSVVTELLWFLKGDTNIKYLVDNGCNIWNKDAYNYYCKRFLEIYPDFEQNLFTIEEFVSIIKKSSLKELKNPQSIGEHYTLGDLGKVYGHYWRNFNGADQIKQLIDDMINKPMSSELLVVARDPSHKEEQALPCCHYGFQIVIRPLKINEQKLFIADNSDKGWSINYGRALYGFELHWKQRSVDTFLGLPFNIASYALLALILEKITGHKALAIQGDLKKVHLYENSLEAATELIHEKESTEEVELTCSHEFDYLIAEVLVNGVGVEKIVNQLNPDWFTLKNYHPKRSMKVEMLSRDIK